MKQPNTFVDVNKILETSSEKTSQGLENIQAENFLSKARTLRHFDNTRIRFSCRRKAYLRIRNALESLGILTADTDLKDTMIL